MEIRLNLSSRSYLNRRATHRWLLLVCLFMVGWLLLNGYYASQNYHQLTRVETRLAELQAQLAEAHGVKTDFSQENLAEVRRSVTLANMVIEADQFRWTRLLDRFEQLLPDHVSIKTIQPNYSARTLKISAVAKTVTDMTEFIDKLLASDDLKKVQLHRHAEAKGKDQGAVIGFSITIEEAF